MKEEKETTKAATTASENKSKNFEPKEIGMPDMKTVFAINAIYQRITRALNELKAKLETCIGREDPVSIDEFIDFLRSENKKRWIQEKYVSTHEIEIYPGRDIFREMDLNLVAGPNIEGVNTALTNFENEVRRLSEEKYYYPLQKLWVEESNEFNTVENGFFDDCTQYYSWKTANEKQNHVLEKVEKLCEALNDLAQLGILNHKKGYHVIDDISAFIEIHKYVDAGNIEHGAQAFTVDRRLFLRHGFGRFRGDLRISDQLSRDPQFREKNNLLK